MDSRHEDYYDRKLKRANPCAMASVICMIAFALLAFAYFIFELVKGLLS